MKPTGTIILLNGVGSAGKSSIAKALQTLLPRAFLHVQMDDFLGMLPDAWNDHPDGFVYERAEQDGKPIVAIRAGRLGEAVLRGMRHAIAALAAQGNDLIVDDVTCNGEMADHIRLLSPFELHTVGVFAPLDVLEARERERGDRMIGLARWQYDRVHCDVRYDLEVDTSLATPLECARLIRERFRL